MTDSNGLSKWGQRDERYQLQAALRIFLEEICQGWLTELTTREIKTLKAFAEACREDIGGAKTSSGSSSSSENHVMHSLQEICCPKDIRILQSRLSSFLPSTIGFQCIQLAHDAVERVERGTAKTLYVHRGGKQGEKWIINSDNAASSWTLHVDCAGFIRNVIKSVTGSEMLVSLSDRDFMRAKDFYTFFECLPNTAADRIISTIPNENDISNSNVSQSGQQLKWCRVDDLRQCILGDIIVYRAKGGAAGGSVFVKRESLRQALVAVKSAELYDSINEESGDHQPVAINVAKLPEVNEWVAGVMAILSSAGIDEIEKLRGINNGTNDDDDDNSEDSLQIVLTPLIEQGMLSENTVSLLEEVLNSRNGNTGHIMFAAGPAEEISSETHIWRIPVYHSTGVGPKSKRGVQRAYKRFEYSPKHQRWTRGGPQDDDVEGGHIEVVVGRMSV